MRVHLMSHCRFIALSVLVVLVGCKSSSENSQNSDSAAPADSPVAASDTKIAAPDLASPSDVAVSTDTTATAADVADAAAPDANTNGLDIGTQGFDAGKPGLDAPLAETGATAVDTIVAVPDGGGTDTNSTKIDAVADAVEVGFSPGPATAVVVNSGPTAQFSLSDGTWKVFYFDALAGQVYAVSELSGIVRGYVSADPSVSSGNYQWATNTDGNLSFVAPATQRYYIAVVVNGGGTSGSFQVADGGKPVALGSTTLTLTAPTGDDYYFYRFPISSGHGYTLSATGPSQPNVGIAVSPKATRSLYNQFSESIWGVAGSLPFTNEDIPSASVANSYSGFYYFYVRVLGDITFTLTITESP